MYIYIYVWVGVYQKLNASSKHDKHGLELLSTLLASHPLSAIPQQNISYVFQLQFERVRAKSTVQVSPLATP